MVEVLMPGEVIKCAPTASSGSAALELWAESTRGVSTSAVIVGGEGPADDVVALRPFFFTIASKCVVVKI